MAEELTPALYNRAILAINELYKTDEVKEWINRAAAYAEYARQAKDDTMEKQAKEIRVRAQRRMGELLLVLERGKRGPKPSDLTPDTVASPGGDTTENFRRPTAANSSPLKKELEDNGIPARTAREWQAMARLPQEEFERKHIEPIHHPPSKYDKFINSMGITAKMEGLQLDIAKYMKNPVVDKIQREMVVERARLLMNTVNKLIVAMEGIAPSTEIRRVK